VFALLRVHVAAESTPPPFAFCAHIVIPALAQPTFCAHIVIQRSFHAVLRLHRRSVVL
jgi:hypothetical protein